jgi:U3 small nucleolar RNA-associated protein 12
MKFFLSLYGHKLPVMTMDLSSDSTLIVTGSADKNVKIWGLDFGDCHKSLFAHDDSVMRVAFIPETHMFLTAGKDGVIKYWDADKFEHIMTLEGHQSEVWALAMSSDGMFFITGGHDRSLRFWNQTDNAVYVDDQRETEMEENWEKTLEAEDAGDRMEVDEDGEKKGEAAPVVRKSLESIKDAEKIIEALDLVDEQQQILDGYNIAVTEAEKSLTPQQLTAAKKSGKELIPYPDLSPLLLGRKPSEYLLYVITRIRSSNLESALVVLTFTQVLSLLKYLEEWIRKNKELILCSRVLFSLLRMHQIQISANRSLKNTIESLREFTHKRLEENHQTILFNLAAMDHIRRLIDDNDASDFFEVSEKLANLRKEKALKSKAKKKNYWESSDEEGGGDMDVDDGDRVLEFAEDSDD